MSDASQGTDRALEAREPRILNCARCGSHFQQITDEELCERCIKWAALDAELAAYRKGVRE